LRYASSNIEKDKRTLLNSDRQASTQLTSLLVDRMESFTMQCRPFECGKRIQAPYTLRFLCKEHAIALY